MRKRSSADRSRKIKIIFSNMELLVSLMRAIFSRVIGSKCLIGMCIENGGRVFRRWKV